MKKTLKTLGIIIVFLILIFITFFILKSKAFASEERSYIQNELVTEQVVSIQQTEEIQSTEETTIVETTQPVSQEVTTSIKKTTNITQTQAVVPTESISIVGILTDQQAMDSAAQNAPKYIGLVNEAFSILNQKRVENNLQQLELDSTLIQVAMLRAAEMAYLDNGTSQVSHTRPNGTSFSSAAKLYGVGYSLIGENICDVLSTPISTINAFMNSPSHRANILGQFSKVGFGIAQAKDGTYYWVQIFIMQ